LENRVGLRVGEYALNVLLEVLLVVGDN